MWLWILSFVAFFAGLGLAGAMAWLEKHPREDLSTRLIPTTPIMFIGFIIALLAVAHMLSLGGVDLPAR